MSSKTNLEPKCWWEQTIFKLQWVKTKNIESIPMKRLVPGIIPSKYNDLPGLELPAMMQSELILAKSPLVCLKKNIYGHQQN